MKSFSTLRPDGIPSNIIGKEPTEIQSNKGYKNFTVIQNSIKKIDWLYLDSSGHRRLIIELKNNIPNFNWIIP